MYEVSPFRLSYVAFLHRAITVSPDPVMTTYSIRRNVPSATSYMYDKVPRVVNVRESISSFERKNLNATTLIFATKGRRPINKEPNNYYNVNCGFLCIYTNLTILGKAQNTDYDSGSKRAPESGRSTLYPYPNKSSNSRYHFNVSRNTQLQHRKGRLSSKSSKGLTPLLVSL